MSCPFYNASIMAEDRGMGRTSLHLVQGPGPSNRCALITSAHSPCWMEIEEERTPDWEACPRNPMWVATIPRTLDLFTDETHAALGRYVTHRVFVAHLRRASQLIALETGAKPL